MNPKYLYRTALVGVVMVLLPTVLAATPVCVNTDGTGAGAAPPPPPCSTTDGNACTFTCIAGHAFYVTGHNDNSWFDYDGYADCGQQSAHCRSANGETPCTDTKVATTTDTNGSCYAYNDWGPTEHTTCGSN